MDITDFQYLYKSMEQCKKNVLWKESVSYFTLNGIKNCLKLEEELKTNTYKPRPTYSFKITYPKERDIMSIHFRDRVYQRSMNDNILYPIMTKSFIHDNCSCQKDRGTDYARRRLKCFLNRYYRKYETNGYVLQIDLKKYYPTMSHKAVLDLFKSKLDEVDYLRVKDILEHQFVGDKGYNAGSQMVQLAGISLLDKLDHYCKEKLHIKFYVRYMDDIVIISNNKELLEVYKILIEQQLNKVECVFNQKKTHIYELSKGIMFLGFRFKLTDSGKVLMTINPKNIKDKRRKYKRMLKVSKDISDKSFECFLANIDKGNNNNIKRKMIRFYNNLQKGRNYGDNKKTKKSTRTSPTRKCGGFF